MSGELSCCPFCGQAPTSFPSGDGAGVMVQCITPGCVNPHVSYYGDGVAFEKWNRRAPDQSAELVSELVERLKLARTALVAQGTSPTARGIADIDATLAKAGGA